jgi:hypothetical protein
VAADNTVDIGALQYRPAPTVPGKEYTTSEDTPLLVNAANGVQAGASDPDGLVLSAARVAGPAHGTVGLQADGSFTYTPAAGYSGADSFEFLVVNYQGRSATATADVTVSEYEARQPC